LVKGLPEDYEKLRFYHVEPQVHSSNKCISAWS